MASTARGQSAIPPPHFQFELKHVQQCFEHVQHHKARNNNYFIGIYLMIQAESRGEPIDKVGVSQFFYNFVLMS
jgi:hypothetical protein